MMSPQQQIFTACRKIAIEVINETQVIDRLDQKASYPLIYIGEQSSQDEENKSAVFGRVQQTLHFYDDDLEKRGRLSLLMDQTIRRLRRLESVQNYGLNLENVRTRMISDTSSERTLLHGVLELEFKFY